MLSVDVLSTLSIAGAHIIYCDKNHLPCAVTYTLNSYYKPLTAIENQMSLSKETKDKQYDSIEIVSGEKTREENLLDTKEIIEL